MSWWNFISWIEHIRQSNAKIDKGCFISFDPLFVLSLSSLYSMMKKILIRYFWRATSKLSIKKKCIQLILILRENYISKDFEKTLISAFSIFLNKNWTFQYSVNITLNFSMIWLDSTIEKIAREILYKIWSKLVLQSINVKSCLMDMMKLWKKIIFHIHFLKN
jgi:hypothetical protein